MLLNKTALLFLIYFFISSEIAEAQADIRKDSLKGINLIIKADVLLPVVAAATNLHLFSVSAEKLFCKHHSIQLSFLDTWTRNASQPAARRITDNFNTWQIAPEYKYYMFKKKKYTGYYIGAFVMYTQYHDKNTLYFLSQTLPKVYEEIEYSLSCGFINGYQLYLFKHITIDFLLGLGVKSPVKYKVVEGNIENDYKSSLIFRAAVNIGVRF